MKVWKLDFGYHCILLLPKLSEIEIQDSHLLTKDFITGNYSRKYLHTLLQDYPLRRHEKIKYKRCEPYQIFSSNQKFLGVKLIWHFVVIKLKSVKLIIEASILRY